VNEDCPDCAGYQGTEPCPSCGQLPLDWTTVRPGARTTDPISSHVAAAKAETFARGQAKVVVDLVELHPGLTAETLAELPDCPLDKVQIGRRLGELEAGGWIRRERHAGGLTLFPARRSAGPIYQRSRAPFDASLDDYRNQPRSGS
jgi:hypothetical protein